MQQQTAWSWVEGQMTNARGDETWFPLYCTRSRAVARALLRFVLDSEERQHVVFSDFRIVHPGEGASFSALSREVSRYSEGVRTVPVCPQCGASDAKRVRRQGTPFWRCQSCKTRWHRGPLAPAPQVSRAKKERVEAISRLLAPSENPGSASVKPVEALKPTAKGSGRPKRSRRSVRPS